MEGLTTDRLGNHQLTVTVEHPSGRTLSVRRTLMTNAVNYGRFDLVYAELAEMAAEIVEELRERRRG